MKVRNLARVLLCGALVAGGVAGSQQKQASQEGVEQDHPQNLSPTDRAARTRAFLGLGAVPDKAAATRGAPIFKQNCGFCHGQTARGATGPSLLTSDVVLGDDHGEHLAPFLRQGRPDEGMPAFAQMTDRQLTDVAEFLHQQVEDVANRGAYHVLNILVGRVDKGKAYVEDHCMSCHTTDTFAHIAGKFRSPEQLQRNWIWPSRSDSITANVTAAGQTISGRISRISDFRVTLIDASGETHTIDRGPGVTVELKDSLSAHREIVMTLTNDDMHNVTAYLETLK
jgi:mono/diheme cytochrome c family protein